MSFQPTLSEQQVLAETFRQAGARMTVRDRFAELLAAGVFAAGVAALFVLQPPRGLELEPALTSMFVLLVATLVRFETPFGFTVPMQLGFVPLLFAMPLAWVPVATLVSLTLARIPEVLQGKLRPSRLLQTAGNSCFALGPPLVFVLAGRSPQDAGVVLLLAALIAEGAVDYVVSGVRTAIERGADLASQLREWWVYAVDAALSGIAYEVAINIHDAPAATLTMLPLLALLAVFARERHQRLEGLLELNSAYRGTALVLGDVVEADDGYTGEHSRGVVGLALTVAERLGLGAEERRNLEFAALLHDVGKIAIPKEIINKPGKLDPEEWTVIKTHTLEGQKILDRVGGFMREVGLVVRSHHERWDGLGYPDGLAGEDIPLGSRIIAACDTWNAMRTNRAYRTALPFQQAIDELHAVAGSQLDPQIVAILAPILLEEQPADGPEHVRMPAGSLTLTDRSAGLDDDPEPVAAQPHVRRALDRMALEDVRAADPVERLLEDSWSTRRQRATRRELIVESVAAAGFLATAIPMAAPAIFAGQIPLGLTEMLVALYAVARTIKFPIGAGSVVPSYLVLVPMLLLLPPSTVPLLTAAGLVIGAALRLLTGRGHQDELLFSIPDAWHAVGPAAVLIVAGPVHGVAQAFVYAAALIAGLLLDLIVSTLRESLANGVAPRLQGRVIAIVWLVDACIAPVGLLVAHVARTDPAGVLLVVPLIGLLMIADRDRSRRIEEAQHRLGIVARERTRLQSAVHHLGDAFAAKLDLGALIDVLLGGSIDALDADAGLVQLQPPDSGALSTAHGARQFESVLAAAGRVVQSSGRPSQLQIGGCCALAMPVTLGGDAVGAVAVARREREFREDEWTLLGGLVERAERAAADILMHEALRVQAMTDPLTRLGNRRKLSEDLGEQIIASSAATPVLLMLFDLNGFKVYNDTFGHVAGDALLARLGRKLAAAVAPAGNAYRLGGDEFCVLLPALRDQLHAAVVAAAGALEEHGEKFAISASCGTVLLPHEASTIDYALQLADERMYSRKQGRSSGAREQAHDVLIHIIRAKQPLLPDPSGSLPQLAVAVGRRLGMDNEQLDELARAAALHDVGKVGVPDAILTKPGPLDASEWEFVRQHTVLGERILSAAPALRPVATIVRASHERWDGSGYPDGLRGEAIPLAARIVAVCDAYQAMTTERCYRPARTSEFARRELRREGGRQFDPAVVEVFLGELDRGGADEPAVVDPEPSERSALAAAVVSQVDELIRGRAA